MSRKTFTVVAVVGALALPAAAGAEIATFAEAKRGKLHVLSSVLVARKAADMRGGWFNTAVPCTAERRLRVTIEVHRSTANSGAALAASKTRRVANCAEGGPNLGFNVTARSAGFACPDGTWRRGRYDFVTRTKHLASGVVAVASLGWTKHGAC